MDNTDFNFIETLRDSSVLIKENITFECKIENVESAVWYHNGRVIHPDLKYTLMTVDEISHRLMINKATKADIGVYTFFCTNGIKKIECKATLSVLKNTKKVFLSRPCDLSVLGTSIPLKSVIRRKGQQLILSVVFKTESSNKIMWLIDECPIGDNDKRRQLFRDGRTSYLIIHKVGTSDTGVYTAISKTTKGISSTYCDVRVIDEVNSIAVEEGPRFLEGLPKSLEINIGETAQLYFKVSRSKKVKSVWYIDDEPLDFDDGIHFIENFGPDYVGIRIMGPAKPEPYMYTLYLKDAKRTVRSSCLYFMKKPASIEKPDAIVIKPLEAVVASCGQHLVLNCQFFVDKNNIGHKFVVWYVGRYIVKRTNNKFKISLNSGSCLLNIERLEYGMEGQTVCQLRMYEETGKSVVLCESVGFLSLVPEKVLFDYMNLSTGGRRQCLHQIETVNPILDETYANILNPAEQTVEIFYYRLDDKYYYAIFNWVPDNQRIVLGVSHEPLQEITFREIGAVSFLWHKIVQNENIVYEVKLITESVDGYLGITPKPSVSIANVPSNVLIRISVKGITRLPTHEPQLIVVDYKYIERIFKQPSLTTIRPIMLRNDRQRFHFFKRMDHIIDNYEYTGQILGSGSFGVVHLLRYKMKINTYYAGKLLRTSNNNMKKRAQVECDMLQSLNHENIISVFEVCQSDHQTFIITEYLSGDTLLVLLHQGPLKESDVVHYIEQICKALSYLAKQKVVHLDVNPDNIMLVHPNKRHVKLIDFGIARRVTKKTPFFAHKAIGTEGYRAPELCTKGIISCAADMWSLGITMYVLLTQDMIFKDETLLKEIVKNEKIPDNSSSSDSSSSSDDYTEEMYTGHLIPSNTFAHYVGYTQSGINRKQRDCNVSISTYIYHNKFMQTVSSLGKTFLERLLTVNYKNRMTATKALRHPWITDGPKKPNFSDEIVVIRPTIPKIIVSNVDDSVSKVSGDQSSYTSSESTSNASIELSSDFSSDLSSDSCSCLQTVTTMAYRLLYPNRSTSIKGKGIGKKTKKNQETPPRNEDENQPGPSGM